MWIVVERCCSCRSYEKYTPSIPKQLVDCWSVVKYEMVDYLHCYNGNLNHHVVGVHHSFQNGGSIYLKFILCCPPCTARGSHCTVIQA